MDESSAAVGIVLALVVLFLVLPAKYDPVIRLREWLNGDS